MAEQTILTIVHYFVRNVINWHQIIKKRDDVVLYKKYFLRFSSFKEAANYYGVDTELEVYLNFALELAGKSEEEITKK